MLETILRHLNNFFFVDFHNGEFAVVDGTMELPFLQTNQYFWVAGSVFNDGLHQYPAADLTDETFNGSVWALAIPKAVLELAAEIEAWQKKNGEAAASPYQSESFAGYSYTKGTDAAGGAVTWQSAFRSRLNEWRKL